VLILVSLAGPPPSAAQLVGLTFGTRSREPDVAASETTPIGPRLRRWHIAASIMLAAGVGAVWLYFRG